ncbi:MAG: tRNA lysidine(34) synthetase TilS, partial [Clostridia bacterium]|nr:tRNA lysidine(34) synthetase TilS [Clostridia bacterium]
MMQLRGYENKKLCVALSGGVDSVALLHMLNAEKNSGGFLLSAVHCEHGIRGEESRLDMEFVQTLCAAWKIPLRVARADCPRLAKERGESLETAARAFRYGVFQTILDGGEADYIVLAHHALDEAETVLFRLARGTSLSGAAAMKEKNGKFLRPLLAWSKEEI